ncbi:MAG TPA: Holliday junction branch migration protein RuvA [Candidatus Bariatricus faecipullorum]|nr:Holliday junction branch migration protein RuvA [Candidatus Bariatricus faecipullorum]
MISYIRGELAWTEKDKAVVDVGGVGFGIYMPEKTMTRLPAPGEEVRLYTFLNVKEEALQLFGFLSRDELELFRLITGVSGIGPRGGLSILSALSPDELRFAVLAGDAKAISAAQGIGKKTAEKLILELKDRLKIEDVLSPDSGEEKEAPSGEDPEIQSDAVQALVALGYGSTEALRAVRKVKTEEGADAGDILKQALKYLM